MNYQGMNIRRNVFINECCCACGGNIYRLLLGSSVDTDDSVGSILQTKVVEKCACTVARAVSNTVPWPCLSLDTLFDQWAWHQLTREEFDARLDQILRKAGAQWSGKTG